MRGALAIVAVVLASSVANAQTGDLEEIIGKRGDANNDDSVNVSDLVFLLNYLSGGPTPTCMVQADVNDDGSVNIADTAYLSNWLLSSGPAPPAPGPVNPNCDPDTTPAWLGCYYYYCE